MATIYESSVIQQKKCWILLLVFAGAFVVVAYNRKRNSFNITKSALNNTDSHSTCDVTSYDEEVTRKQKCLVFNMVPKCGSAGIRFLISKLSKKLHYTSSEGRYVFKSHIKKFHHKTATMKKVLRDMQGRCDKSLKQGKKYIYYRHQHFANYSLIRNSIATPFHTNMIRDPVEHYISWYVYRRHGAHSSSLVPLGKKINMNASFEECVVKNHKECLLSIYTYNIIPYFCGHEDFCLEPSQNSLDYAKRNVAKYFPVVGYLENVEQYLELCEYFWPQFYKGAKGKYLTMKRSSSRMRYLYEPSPSVKLQMKERMSYDYAFYNWIKQRFHCQYRKHLSKLTS